MICDGFMKGTIEGMLYGMTASSQDDLMTGFSFKDPPKDCVWLGTVETSTREDPFRSADLIWALPKLPPMLDQVDVCYLKATGVEMDANGEKYGYMVLHGVHIAQCPPFAAHGISRAKMYFACLFREPRPGLLKVTVRGIFDLSKKVRMLKGLVSAATTSIMVGLFNGVGIGEAKKLTLLAKRNQTTIHVRPAEPEFLVVAEFYLSQRSRMLPEIHAELLPRNDGMKTNSSAGVPTTSTTDESVGEYQLDFDDDSFSIALTLPELRRSSIEDVDNKEPDSSPEAEAGSFSSEIMVWGHRISVDDDDFIPSTAADRLYSAIQMEQRLLELNMQAEQIYAQTQETTMSLRGWQDRR
ncbi:hypothetical protein PInf_014593 [Phytophthora infestans]|nr:hypothetical protein PInf_014593 [Phytophthora infestans]